jgi:hypothetical protein
MTLKWCYLEDKREELMNNTMKMLGFDWTVCIEEEEQEENGEVTEMEMCYSFKDIKQECFMEIDPENAEQQHCV